MDMEEVKLNIEQTENEIVKKSVSKLYEKLQELQEKLEKEELSPIKRFLLESKLSIIETRLERQLAKLDIPVIKKQYEQEKDGWYEKHNEILKEKQEELDDLFEQIEKQERIIGQKTSNMKDRNADYNEINNIGRDKSSSKNTRSTYQFTSTKKIDEVLQKQQEKLEELKAKKDLKKEEIINFRKEFIENEREADTEFAESLKEYKPSIWQSFKTALKKISDNFTNWRKNSKQERKAVKEAKAQAIKDARKEKNIDSITENIVKMELFKERVNSHISLEEQSKYSEEAIEKVEGEVIEEHQEKWRAHSKRKALTINIPKTKKEKAKTYERKKKRQEEFQKAEEELLELEKIIEQSKLNKEIEEEAKRQVMNDPKNLQEIEKSLSSETQRLMIGIQSEIIRREKNLDVQRVQIDENEAIKNAQLKAKKMPEEQQK